MAIRDHFAVATVRYERGCEGFQEKVGYRNAAAPKKHMDPVKPYMEYPLSILSMYKKVLWWSRT